MRIEVPLFPLRFVIFDGGFLELIIFEPRYLRMIREAISDDTGFGIVLLQQGPEVANDDEMPLTFANIGTLVSIKQHDTLTDGRIEVIVEGGPKFRVHSTWIEEDHLTMSLVDFLGDEPKLPLRDRDRELLEIFDRMDELHIAEGQTTVPLEENNATALGYRLAEILPISMEFSQSLLELDSPYVRLDRIQRWIREERAKV